MKKTLLVIASLILATALIAEPKAGNSTLSLYGGFGINATSGQIYVPLTATAESTSVTAYGFGALFGYYLSDGSGIVLGAEYAYEPMAFKIEDSGTDVDLTFKQSFIEIIAGYRGFSSGLFYWGLGFFYGIRMGDAKTVAEGMGMTVETTINEYAKSPMGLYAELGYSIPMAETATFDLGVRGKVSFTDSYKNGNEYLKFTHLGITAGVSFIF